MIKQAIIPLAGLGTRLLPLTSVIQKELLPLNGKPNLEYIMEECVEAGIKQFIFIVPKNRPTIKNYFFNDSFYKRLIKKKKLTNNEEYIYKDLSIKSLKCTDSEFDDNPEIKAYIQVRDLTKKNRNNVFVFNGWMFSSSPSIAPFDHPVYDIWLINCY